MQMWQLRQLGARFANGFGTVREVVAVNGDLGPAKDCTIHWRKIKGDGPDKGIAKWTAWRRFCVAEWFEPRPVPLPVPKVSAADRAFPTNKATPPWRWVPDEFRSGPGGAYENRHNPWVKLVADIFMGNSTWTRWKAIPKPGINAKEAFDAVCVALGNWGQKHEQKLATCGWMLSEWFEDFWFEGDTHSTVHNHLLKEWIKS